MTSSQVQNETTRCVMTNFWEDVAKMASTEEMMLDSQATLVKKQEETEILSFLPDLKNKKVLELAAGIGRFTGILADMASHVTAVDFIDIYIEKNKEENKCHTNIDYITDDVTKLNFDNERFDVIFINWLMMYLSDKEVQILVENMLSWLTGNGFIFFRESCWSPGGNYFINGNTNPTNYRSPVLYNNLFQNVSAPDKSGKHWRFRIVFAKFLLSYFEVKKKSNQICWLMQKVPCKDGQKYMALQQFSSDAKHNGETGRNAFLKYQSIFGDGFLSPGGLEITKELLEMLKLKSGQKVLDAGCGIGGSDFFMAKEYKVDVFGVDVSSNMVEIAWDKITKKGTSKVLFDIGDIMERNFPVDYFDAIYCREVISYIKDQLSLFKLFRAWLKPGGKILISDFDLEYPPFSNNLQINEEEKDPKPNLCSHLNTTCNLLEEAGFINVQAEDRSEQFATILSNEMERIGDCKRETFKDFTEEELKSLIDGWNLRLSNIQNKEQIWGLFTAENCQ